MGRTEGSSNMPLTVKRLIFETAVTDTKKPRRALATELQDLLERMGEVVPSEETIEKLISRARNRDPHPQDASWSMISVGKYPDLFPPESLPSVLRAWVYARELDIDFTVRQAKWVARLYAVLKDIDELVKEALGMAQMELVADIIPDGVIDSKGSDLHLFEIMTGEEVSKERRYQILGINKEWFEAKLASLPGKDASPKPRRHQKIHPGDMSHFGDRNRLEKTLKAYSLIMREVKSDEDWAERIPKLERLFSELGLKNTK